MAFRNWLLGGQTRTTLVKPEVIQPEIVHKNQTNKRMFMGARPTRNSTWQITLEPAHKAILRDMRALRAHSRDLCQNNAYAARYCQLAATNVIGDEGFILESCIKTPGGDLKTNWNTQIEDSWTDWGTAVTTDGRMNWCDFQAHVMKTVVMDGEVFIHVLRGFPNKYGLALEIIDADSVDWAYSAPADSQGNRTIMGILFDRWMRRTSYRIWVAANSEMSAHPIDWEVAPRAVLIPADEVLHIVHEDRVRSVRGIPWATPVLNQFSMLGRLLQAELDSAIEDAKRVAVVTGPAPVEDEDGEIKYYETRPADTAALLQDDFISEDSPSQVWGLDDGQDIKFPSGTHPNNHLPPFQKMLLEGIASGLSVAYHALSGDVSSANYTASQVALMDQNAYFLQLQNWFRNQLCIPIYKVFLQMALATGELAIPVNNWEKLFAPKFWPKSLEHIDPTKDNDVSRDKIRSGLSNYQIECGKQGKNWMRMMDQRAIEQAYQRKLGLHLELDNAKAASNAPSDPAIPDESDQELPPTGQPSPGAPPAATPAPGGKF